MKTEFTATIKKDGDWWIGWIEEIPGANAQERTKKELIISLKEAAYYETPLSIAFFDKKLALC